MKNWLERTLKALDEGNAGRVAKDMEKEVAEKQSARSNSSNDEHADFKAKNDLNYRNDRIGWMKELEEKEEEDAEKLAGKLGPDAYPPPAIIDKK